MREDPITIIYNVIDNDWKMDESIRDYIYKDMDPNYNLEEKIAFIYLKLCLILEYEESYLLFDNIKSTYKKRYNGRY